MVSLKTIVPVLALALQAVALPATDGSETNILVKKVCLPPSNCSPIGNCAYCCASGVTPNSASCHTHGTSGCPAGSTNYHCDEDH